MNDGDEEPRWTGTRIVKLASDILKDAKQIEHFLTENKLPTPSFEINCMDDLPSELEPAQNRLLQSCDELTALIQGPQKFISSFAKEHNRTTSLHAIIHFKIAQKVPLDSTMSIAELSTATGLAENDIAAIIRHAATYRIFMEVSPGVIAHTGFSRLLATDSNISNLVDVALDELLPASTRVVSAMQKWPHSEEPSETGAAIANNSSKPLFELLEEDPERAKRFIGSMKGFLDSPAFSPRHLVEDFYWKSVKKVVDVGGSSGAIAVALAREYENLTCVVQDLPGVIAMTEIPEDLTDRVTTEAHDMFEEQTVLDADVYLLRFILHDWSDKYAAKILRNLVSALKLDPRRRILINDACLPEFGAMSLYDQRFARATSLSMKAIQNGRERSRSDWESVLSLADPQLELMRVVTPPGSALSIMVVRLG